MNDRKKQQLISVYRDELLDDTLSFWMKHGVDHQYGGFLTSLAQDGAIVDTDKSVWQQGRFTWLLGELFNNVEQRSDWLALAKHGVEFLEKYCFDQQDGRMWFHLTRDGRPIRKRRYSYSESFAAIAFGEYAKATGDQRYAEKAVAAFNQFLEHNRNPDTPPKFTDVRPTRGIGFPMIAIVTAQELRESIGLESANESIDRCVKDIRDTFVKPEIDCVMETTGPDGELIDSHEGRMLNAGHAIECAWFILQEGKHRSDSQLVNLGCQMMEWMLHRGWDPEYGGLLYFVDVDGKPVQEYWHDMKFWWPHNEAIIATLLAWSLTKEEKYLNWHQQVHDWAYSHFPDQKNGEWFGYLHRDGSVSSTAKGNLWKGPFHLPRMQLKCWQILAEQEDDLGKLPI